MSHGHLWRLAAAALGAAVASTVTILVVGQSTPDAHAAAPRATTAAAVAQWGTVRAVEYHSTGAADAHSLIAIVELYDGRRFVHAVSGAVRRLPAPGEVWNIEGDMPPAGWKPRK